MSVAGSVPQDSSTAGSSWVSIAIEDAAQRQGLMSLPKEVCMRVAEARGVWAKLLFPTPKVEAWKYTDTEAIAKGPFALAASRDEKEAKALLEKAIIPDLNEAARIVFVDGVYSEALSKRERVMGAELSIMSEGTAGAALLGSLEAHCEEPFAALATALFSDGVCLQVARASRVNQPIHVIHVSTGASSGVVSTPRLLVEAHESSEVAVVESFVGVEGARYLSLPVAELIARDNARIDYYKIQNESLGAYHVSNVTALQQRDAEVRTHIFSFGGSLVRNNAQTLLKGAQSRSTLNGLSLLAGEQHVDNTTLIHHIEPSAESVECFKGIYADKSRGVFSGTITVEKIAQKTNAFQSNQALLLSSEASIESRPQLKIWADDVKCTHGATVGQLDKDALFYLQSRGVGRDEAKAFLVHAFASGVLTSVKIPAVKESVECLISERLSASL